MTIPVVARAVGGRRRGAYNRVGTSDDDIDDDHVDSTSEPSEHEQQQATAAAGGSSLDGDSIEATSNEDSSSANGNSGEYINLVILDTAQTKFSIPNVQSDWTISKLKKVGSKIHKVSPTYQRLIYRGQMLDDTKTLEDYSIKSQQQLQKDLDALEEGTLNSKSKKKRKNKKKQQKESKKLEDLEFIIHLFPKPRVVVINDTSNENDGLMKNTSCTATSSSSEDGQENASGENVDEEEGGSGGGAHIPQIILNAQEARERGTILVLGGAEIGEAQNNVKFLSLLLLFVCSMRLLALASIASGAPPPDTGMDPGNHTSLSPNHHTMMNSSHTSNGNPMMGVSSYYGDDEFGITPNADGDMDYGYNSGGTGIGSSSGYQDNETTRPWEQADWFDLIVSVIGFYVATLGLKATTENTLRLATAYFVGIIIAGILWNIWNVFVYAVFVRDETEWDHNGNDGHDSHGHSHNNSTDGGGGFAPPNDGTDDDEDITLALTLDDYMTVAFFTVGMPMMVWVWCCVRAYQFRSLIQEAEQEAAERRLATNHDDDNDPRQSEDEHEDDDENHESHQETDELVSDNDDEDHRVIV